ncbi:MAG: hypothetical protein C0505_04005 [Leptothrix sp. (in: Bacteria)]|nr:hypothetical protein [Leptothrix sp. (in: b-proteobacteria)]
MAQRLVDHPLAWTAPPPFWPAGAGSATATARSALARPQILRFASDDFMDELLATLENDPTALTGFAAAAETWRGAGAAPQANPASWLDRSPARLLGVQRKALQRARAAAPAAVTTTAPATVPTTLPLKLYQPAHQRHYLVTGALVCQTVGLPDRAIDPARHKVSFMVRRLFPRTAVPPPQKLPAPTELSQWDEYAYVLQGRAGHWQRVGGADQEAEAARRLPGEERHTMFPARYTQDDGHGRRLFVGSVPVGKRETFQGAQAVAAGESAPPVMDPRVALFHKQVLGPWKAMVGGAMLNGAVGAAPTHLAALRAARLPAIFAELGDDGFDTTKPDADALRDARSRLQTASWLLLLDLLHFLQQQARELWLNHVLPGVPPPAGPWRNFYDALDQARMPADLAGAGWTLNSAGTGSAGTPAVSLYDLHPGYRGRTDLHLLPALRRAAGITGLEAQLDAAQDTFALPTSGTAAGWPDFLFLFADPWFGVLTPPAPTGFVPQTSDYLAERIVALIDALGGTLAAALATAPAADPTLPEAPLASRQPADMREAWYVMRLVYERPDCAPLHGPVVSQATAPFQMAGFFDPDAPARPIRIGLPLDISPAGLRKFDKNTVFVMSDMLCGHIDRMKGLSFGDLVLSVLPFPFHKGLSVPEKGPCKQGADPLGVMCSLSIPIITLCALILLMIIVSLLDLIFRWLPYFVVCFPLPGFKGKKEP